MASFQSFGISSVSQICKLSLYWLEAIFTATMFPDLGRYTTPSKGFTFLSCIDAIQQLLQFRIFINKCNVWPLCNGVQGRVVNLSCHQVAGQIGLQIYRESQLSPVFLSHHQGQYAVSYPCSVAYILLSSHFKRLSYRFYLLPAWLIEPPTTETLLPFSWVRFHSIA